MVWYAENIFNFAPPPHSRPLTRPLTAANRNNFLAARSRPEKLTRGAPFGVELERAIAHGGLCGRGAVRCAVRLLCDAQTTTPSAHPSCRHPVFNTLRVSALIKWAPPARGRGAGAGGAGRGGHTAHGTRHHHSFFFCTSIFHAQPFLYPNHDPNTVVIQLHPPHIYVR